MRDLRAHTPTVEEMEAKATARWTQHAFEGQLGQKQAAFLLQDKYVDTEETENKKMKIYLGRQNAKKFQEEAHHLYDGLLPDEERRAKMQKADYELRKQSLKLQQQKAAVEQVLIEEEQKQELQKQKGKTQASDTKTQASHTNARDSQKKHLRGAPKPVAKKKKKRRSIYPEAKRGARMHTLHN